MVSCDSVSTFVGIDAHSANCSLCALSGEGEILKQAAIATKAADLRRFFKDLQAPVWVMLESGMMSWFVRDALEKVVDRLVVCETRENRLISRSEDKSDAADAHRLARLLRLDEFKEVYLPRRRGVELREMVGAYGRAVSDMVRMKLRIRAKFRRYGISIDGKTGLYDPRTRESWLEKVKGENPRFILENFYEGLDSAERRYDSCGARMKSMMSSRREYRLWKDIPGVGDVVAAIFTAVIDDPSRFPDKHKLWKYAGLAVKRQSSGSSRERKKGSREGNRPLKYAAMMAASNAIRGDNRFGRQYKELVKAGSDPAMAQKTVARAILSAALAMARTGSRYIDEP